ncbi:MAG: hypothetical protein ACTHNU_08170 [Gaiellales bacterium]
MERSRSPRLRLYVPLALVILVAAAAAVAVSARQSDAQTHGSMKMNMSGMVTSRQLAFRNAMRVLWEQHVAWTRLSIVSFAGGLPDLPATESRLLQNQADIGNAVMPFYGAAAGHRLTVLLRHHILIAVAILGDVKSGNQAGLKADLARWYRNANTIAAFLHDANPHNWPLPALRQMMHRHLALTTDEAVAELSGHYQASVQAYDRVEREILGMADMLSTGIIRQFPGRFS